MLFASLYESYFSKFIEIQPKAILYKATVFSTAMLTKILLVEDNPADAHLLKHFLAKVRGQYFEVVPVEKLVLAIAKMRAETFDAILLDLSLPDSQGLKTVVQMNSAAPNVPIIVLTGLDDEETAVEALRDGAQDYLVKNEIKQSLLVRAINYAIERKQMLEKVRASETRYRDIVEDQPELICRFLSDGTLTFVNEAYSRYFDRKPEELVGRHFTTLIPEEDWEKVKAQIAAISLENPTKTLEHRVILPNGEIRWQQWTNRGLFGDRETPREYQAVGRDITDRKQTEQALKQQLARERLIALIAQRICQSWDLSEIFQTTANEIRDFLQVERAIVQRLRPDGGSEVAIESLAEGYLSVLGERLGEPTQFSQRQAREDIYAASLEVWPPELRQKLGVQAQLTAPIVLNQPVSDAELDRTARNGPVRLWGWLIVHQCRSPRQWQQLEINLLQQLANQLEIAIQQSHLYRTLEMANNELKVLASVDGLTKIANRRRFDEYFDIEWRRSIREQLSLALVLCDVDCFKLYNDRYGHLMGDECLQKVAAAIAKAVKRPSDLVARYGGEEFAVILANTNAEGALHIAETIRTQVEALQIPHEKSAVSQYVTLSVGVAGTIPNAGMRTDRLIAIADECLYRAKKSGRNCSISTWVDT